MTLKFTSAALFILSSMFCFSQDSSDLEVWRSDHPNVLIIESGTYNTFSNKQKELLGEYIIIDSELTLKDIESYELQKKSAETTWQYNFYDKKDANYIKQWLGQNPDVKIVNQSYYQSLSTTEQAEYEMIGVMILEGEEITKADIINYINTH